MLTKTNHLDSIFNNWDTSLFFNNPFISNLNTNTKNMGVVEDTNNQKTWYFNVPGIKKEDLQVYIENDSLVVKGESKDKIKHSCLFRMTIPRSLSQASMSSTLSNGVLYITMNKDSERKMIEIK